MTTIVSDQDIFQQFTNAKSRKQYQRTWSQFVDFCGDFDFEAGQPGELLSNYFKFLRLDRKMTSSSLWTVSSIFKRKYNAKLQDLPRLTLLIKGFNDDVKQKAAIFDDAVLKEFMLSRKNASYWLVRQAICIVSFFGGLRYQECMDLELEKIQRSKEGYVITHNRVKQRSDKLESRFIVPETGGYAAQLALYLFKVNNQLKLYQGKVWFTGAKSDKLKTVPMGKNTISQVPHDIAALLGLANPSLYTFHSFRRTSATSAADGGSTAAQMTDFFGWKNPSMCHEYVSSSKPAITKMAQTLAAYPENFSMEDPDVEMEVEVEVAEVVEVAEDSEKNAKEELCKDFMFAMEKDPDMYVAASLPPPVPLPTSNALDVDATVKAVISSVGEMTGANVNIKVVVVSGNSNTNMNF
jgi:integrase